MAGPSLCSQRGLPLLSPRIEESRWTHLPARRPLPLNLILHLFTGRTSLGYSFLLFISFSRCWGSSFGFFSADSWVRAAVAADGGGAGRAMAGARGAGVASVEAAPAAPGPGLQPEARVEAVADPREPAAAPALLPAPWAPEAGC